MKSLRQHLRELEILENETAEIVGMRLLLLDERKLFGSKSKAYIAKLVGELEGDMFPGVIKAAKLGKSLFKEVISI
ncbi:MAG: hypothetical protein KAR42_16825 [candidate division Zixibacteria bacterium]|nr:hypothetical protein [candidate division Zixibacteria bacterium]